MEKIKIALGTISSWKLCFVKKIFDEIGLEYDIKTIKTESEISDQPLTEKETLLGSVNRAKNALAKNSDADIGLGIEVGYDKHEKGNYEMFCCATVCEKNQNLISSRSHKFILPKLHQEVLKDNKNLCDYVKDYYKKDNHPATQYLAKMIDYREPFIIEAVRGVILKFFRKSDFS